MLLALLLSAVEPVAAPELFAPDPAPVKVADDARVQRFMGALAGGVVGAGLGLAFTPLVGTPCGPGVCVSVGQIALGYSAPFLAAIGAYAGYQLMGGNGSLMAGFAGIVPGTIVLAALMLATQPDTSRNLISTVPQLAAGFATLIALSAMALDARQEQLGHSGSEGAPTGRVLAELAAGVGAAVASAILSVGLVALCIGSPACVVAAFVGAWVGSIGTALVTWSVHSALKGKGTAASATLGMAVATVAALISIPVGVALGTRSFGSFDAAVGAASVVGAPLVAVLLFTTMALEWSHTAIVGGPRTSVSVGASPMPGGGVVAASLRF